MNKSLLKKKLCEVDLEIMRTGDKRRNMIEKKQLEFLKCAIGEIIEDRKDCSVSYDSWNTKKWENSWFIDENGRLMKNGQFIRNKLYDSKIFDAVLTLNFNDGRTVDFYFVLKGIHEDGGNQDTVGIEVGAYSNMMIRNKDVNSYFVFVLDGGRGERIIPCIKKSNKYISTTCRDFVNKFNDFLNFIK